MDTIKSHKDLVVWQQSIALASAVYAATRSLSAEERFGLCKPLRRAAVAVATRIAEGSARRTTAEFVQFLQAARGSLSELETQILIASDQGCLTRAPELSAQIDEVGRLLNAQLRSLSSARQAAHARACSVHALRTANR